MKRIGSCAPMKTVKVVIVLCMAATTSIADSHSFAAYSGSGDGGVGKKFSLTSPSLCIDPVYSSRERQLSVRQVGFMDECLF